jgi:hypothetical protein
LQLKQPIEIVPFDNLLQRIPALGTDLYDILEGPMDKVGSIYPNPLENHVHVIVLVSAVRHSCI